jgi:D-glycero-alpha-D-manno-heptose-7-phosphate kinase
VLGGLYTFLEIDYTLNSLAIDAFEIERVLLEIPGGCQDQYVCVTGGFNKFEFKNYREVTVKPIQLPINFLNQLENSAFFVWTGISRNSNIVLSDQIGKSEKRQNIQALLSQKELVGSVEEILMLGDLRSLGEVLSRSWELKRGVSELVSSPEIDKVYRLGMELGVFGGKLLGAGGGGYFIFITDSSNVEKTIGNFKTLGYRVTSFKTSSTGFQVLR